MGAKSITVTGCVTVDKYFIETDLLKFDFLRIHGWLTNAYWSKGISEELVRKSFANSLCFGIFRESAEQVGVARMVTDKATFAYLADVYIASDHRGQGLGMMLMEAVMVHPDLQGLRRIMLLTSDMHKLYEKHGFGSPEKPEIIMEKTVKDIYLKQK